jgi:hypothetical protein
MPNWQIGVDCKSFIRHRAKELAYRPLSYALTDFPLTVAQLQYSTMDADRVYTLRRYMAGADATEKLHTLELAHTIQVGFLRDTIPELRRGLVVKLQLPEGILANRDTKYGYTDKFALSAQGYLIPRFEGEQVLDPETRSALIKWVNRSIRHQRLLEITIQAASQILDNHAPTVAHLHMVWPALTTMFNNLDGVDTSRNPTFYTQWRDRFRAHHKPLRTYRPDTAVYDKYQARIRAADTAIAAGMVLPELKQDGTKEIIASVVNWEKIAGDVV